MCYIDINSLNHETDSLKMKTNEGLSNWTKGLHAVSCTLTERARFYDDKKNSCKSVSVRTSVE